MASYKSLIEFNGKIGDLVFYQLNGKPVVRRKSGFNKEDYDKKESYKAVRQNSSEFGHCSKVGKALREELKEYLKMVDDKYLYQKVARLMTRIKDQDLQNPKGSRKVSVGLSNPLGRKELASFSFEGLKSTEELFDISESLFDLSYSIKKTSKDLEIELTMLSIEDTGQVVIHSTSPINPENNSRHISLDKPEKHPHAFGFYTMKTKGEITGMGFIA